MYKNVTGKLIGRSKEKLKVCIPLENVLLSPGFMITYFYYKNIILFWFDTSILELSDFNNYIFS